MDAASGALRRSVRLADVVMLGAGTAMGASVFTVLGPAAGAGGGGLPVAVALAAAPMAVFGLVYGFMASAVPRTGASYEWQHAFVHPRAAFAISWLRVLGSVAIMVLMARVLADHAAALWPGLPDWPVMGGLLLLVYALNHFGVAVAARAQTVMMLLLLAAFAVFVAAGAPRLGAGPSGPAFPGWEPVLAALPLLVTLYLGIEGATEVGEEVADARRSVPLGLVLALVLALGVYLAVAVTALAAVGPAALAASDAPLVTAAEAALGPHGAPLIAGAAALALVKSVNATFLIFSRYLFAMGRAGALPAALGRVHPRWGTPHVATATAFAAASLGLLLSREVLPLLLAVNVPAMLKYGGTCLAALNVARSHPDVHARARLRLPRPWLAAPAVLGMAAAAAIAVLGLVADWRPYAVCAAWTAAGLAYHGARERRLRRSER
ncbi:APA family basic amino acid/polyamine antiporter [Thermocatellispora tengchongensis]|uniref:APA family basic amino acid/polyamine antiporter n=1 Tax=Thermocatellispora tengchongensis TaxID=1073253 RepID=A0A840PMC2_9ACTN|nr:APC family permease [Thermocatellispora tengchongensis]MBB5138941.1 APA family basic amino acid/polyamine antiporter [Thermocatellispora tengchongensis]